MVGLRHGETCLRNYLVHGKSEDIEGMKREGIRIPWFYPTLK